jgi:hypothetical protein
VRTRFDGAAKLDREGARLARRDHRAVARDDPLGEGRAGARQTEHEYRISGGKSRRTGGEPGSGLRADDAVDLGDLSLAVIVHGAPLQRAGGRSIRERARMLIDIFILLAQGEAQQNLALRA